MLKIKLFKEFFIFDGDQNASDRLYDPFPRAAFLLRDKFASRGAVGKYILSINGA